MSFKKTQIQYFSTVAWCTVTQGTYIVTVPIFSPVYFEHTDNDSFISLNVYSEIILIPTKIESLNKRSIDEQEWLDNYLHLSTEQQQYSGR